MLPLYPILHLKQNNIEPIHIQNQSIQGRGFMNSKGSILLVDDDELVLTIGLKMLEKIGYSALEARNSAEAVAVYQEKRDDIDLVVLDINLPDETGVITYKKLKNINPDAKVILASGYYETPEVTELIKLGCQGRLQKPYTLQNLSEEVSGVLG